MNLSGWYRRFAIVGPDRWHEWLLFSILLPFGVVYGLAGALRVFAYRYRLLKSVHLEVPVVSVGNLVSGGTGKTPMVDYLLNWCRGHGVRAAVLSRGYGGKRTVDLATVCAGEGPLLGPAESGDEPFLLAKRNPDAIVVVGSDRSAAGRVAIDRHQAELLILDDGFQHLRLERDLNLLLADSQRPFGNGRVLPAGYLREFPRAIERADMLILTRSSQQDPVGPSCNVPVLRTSHDLGSFVRSSSGDELALVDLKGKKAIAFCGIADPEPFFSQLKDLGVELVCTHAFPDHFEYPSDFSKIFSRVSVGADFFLTTEKDSVKLEHLELPLPCYQMPLEIRFLDGEAILSTALDKLMCEDKETMPLSKDLLDILACPQCKGEIRLNDDETEVLCDHCRLAFPVRDEIPVMLMDEARSL